MEDRFKFRCWDEKTKTMYQLDGFTKFELPLMQCTGIPDSEGRLIYEGDVLRSDLTPYGRGLVDMPVQWRAETGKWLAWRDLHNWGEGEDFKRMKIIGNIYENPELLEAHDK